MKIYKILLVIVLILGAINLALDKHLFYYGLNELNIYGSLPLELKPVYRYDFEGGFAIEDNYGFYLISSGKHKYVGSEVEINIVKIIKYGIGDEILIAHVKDSIEKDYYIEFLKNEDIQSKQDILINFITQKDELKLNNYKWFKIHSNEKRIKTLELLRNYTFIVLMLLIVIMVVTIVRSKSHIQQV